jgi:hypothetical protein
MDSGRAIFEGSTAQLIADFAPPLVKLEFSGPSVDLPLDLVGALDEQCRTDSGGLRVEARLADSDVAVADVIGVLSESARAALTSASIVAPSLESAYRRLLRVRGADEADRVFSAA